jgi:hypothetical protein
MRINNPTRYAAIAALIGGLACAGNKARTSDTSPNEAAAARDTTSSDTTQNPPGYRGMERDTTLVPRTGQTASDTFLQKQGQGSPQDTAGYSGIERDTTHHAVGADTLGYSRDTTGAYGRDTTGAYGRDTTGASRSRDTSGTASADSSSYQSNTSGLDSTGMSRPTGDTTGYHPTQQSRDSTSR